VVPFDAELGVTSQSEGVTRYRRWDFEATGPDEYPLLLHYPYYLLYSSQVVKQADLMFALYLCGDHFDLEQKQRDFVYYEAVTVRDSSLSASIQAIVAAEVGHLGLAYDYFRETAFIDLRNLAGNTADGLHLASLAGDACASTSVPTRCGTSYSPASRSCYSMTESQSQWRPIPPRRALTRGRPSLHQLPHRPDAQPASAASAPTTAAPT